GKRRPWREACTRQKKGRVLRKSAPANHVWHIVAPWRISQIIAAKKGDRTDFWESSVCRGALYRLSLGADSRTFGIPLRGIVLGYDRDTLLQIVGKTSGI